MRSFFISPGHTYRAFTIEQHLRELAQAGLSTPWGQRLARSDWRTGYRAGRIADSHGCSRDIHEKLLWTQPPVAKGFVRARHAVHACLKQFYLPGRGGHSLSGETHRGDAHRSEYRLSSLEHCEQAIGQSAVPVIVADREGLRADGLLQWHPRKKALITLLRANQ